MSETPQRVVVAKGARVPLPRRLLTAGLLFALLAVALHSLPRPYQPIPIGVVRGLAHGYLNTSAIYAEPPGEPVAGEARDEDRSAYRRELWIYTWWGAFREIVLRSSEALFALCLFGSVAAATIQRRRDARALAKAGVRLEPKVLHTEAIATGAPAAFEPIVVARTAKPAAPAASASAPAEAPAAPAIAIDPVPASPEAIARENPFAPAAEPEPTPTVPVAVPPPVPEESQAPRSPFASQAAAPDPLLHDATQDRPVVKPGGTPGASPNENPGWWPKPGSSE